VRGSELLAQFGDVRASTASCCLVELGNDRKFTLADGGSASKLPRRFQFAITTYRNVHYIVRARYSDPSDSTGDAGLSGAA